MLRVGLTGNVAAGKSSVAELFHRWGAVLVDHDVLARLAVAPGTSALAAVLARFGRDLALPGGELDRAALRRRVMRDPKARADLEAIIHPEVLRQGQAREDEARRHGSSIVVHDIPLLYEVLDPGGFDVVVLVDAPPVLRRERLRHGRGLSPEDADALIAAQAPSEPKRARATFVIDNDATRDALETRAQLVWRELQARARVA